MNSSSMLRFEPPKIEIFGFFIYAYAIIIVCGMVLAFLVISLLFKRRNMSTDLFLTIFVIGLPVAIVCTRLFYCITDGMPLSEWFSFESIRKGGLSIVGGILGGASVLIIICWVKKINFFRVADCIAVGLLLAQSIGRWGNFANQEVYGAEVLNPSLQFFPIAVYIENIGEYHYAFFFYESMVTLTAAILLFINAWRNGKKPNGINTAAYLMTYGLTRTIMEPLRDSNFILGNGIPWSMIMSICMFVAGTSILVLILYNNKIKEGKLIGSANGDPYGITEYIKDNKGEKAYFNKINMMCKIYPENYEENPEKVKKAQRKTSEKSPETEAPSGEEKHEEELEKENKGKDEE